jgi:hypothetical protein
MSSEHSAAGPCPESAAPLSIRRFVVKPDRVCCYVEVCDERYATTTPSLVAQVLRTYPHLLEHTCVNDRGGTFAAVAARTSVAHLVEHMVIEEQTRLEPPDAPARIYTGMTKWVDRDARVARIDVSFADDLVALRAFNRAVDTLNEALQGGGE